MTQAGPLTLIGISARTDAWADCSHRLAAWLRWRLARRARQGWRNQSSVRRNAPRSRSFRFSVRRHRLGDERPPSVSQHANVGQDLLSFVFGHFALRVRQLIEALLDLRPELSAADLAVVL